MARVRGNFEGLEAEIFEQLQDQVIRRRFDRDGIARLAGGSQAERQRFGARVGDDDLVGGEGAAPGERAADELADQSRVVECGVAGRIEQGRLTLP
jgi:hypothetical protein